MKGKQGFGAKRLLRRRPVGFTMESASQGAEGIELVRGALDKGQPFAMARARRSGARSGLLKRDPGRPSEAVVGTAQKPRDLERNS
jgi:hypothetical protein